MFDPSWNSAMQQMGFGDEPQRPVTSTYTSDQIRTLDGDALNVAVEWLLYGDDLTAGDDNFSIWTAVEEWKLNNRNYKCGWSSVVCWSKRNELPEVDRQSLESYVANWRTKAPDRHWAEVWQQSCEQGRPFNLLASNMYVSMADYYRVSFADLDTAVRRQACLLALERQKVPT